MTHNLKKENMKELNFKTPVLDLRGNPTDAIDPILLSVQLGESLAGASQVEGISNPSKVFDWAIQLTNEGVIKVDETDFKVIESFIKANQRMSILFKGQLLKVMESAKDSKK